MPQPTVDAQPRKSKGTLRRLARQSGAINVTSDCGRSRSDSTASKLASPLTGKTIDSQTIVGSTSKHRVERSNSKHFSAFSLAEASGRSIRALYQSARRVSKDSSTLAGSSTTTVERIKSFKQPIRPPREPSRRVGDDDDDENVTIKPIKHPVGPRDQNMISFPKSDPQSAPVPYRDASQPSRTHKGSLSLFVNAVKDKAMSAKTQAGEPIGKQPHSAGLPPNSRSDGAPAPPQKDSFCTPSNARRPDVTLGKIKMTDGSVSFLVRHSPTSITPTPGSSIARSSHLNTSRLAPSSIRIKPSTQSDEAHYTLRLAVTYLVRTVLPDIRLRIRRSEPPIELYQAISDLLQPVARMERAWGIQWMLRRSSDDLQLSERTKEKERGVLFEALQDGLVMRHLVDGLGEGHAGPSKSGLAANWSMFATRCAQVLPDDPDLLRPPGDLTTLGLERACRLVVSLARALGPEASQNTISSTSDALELSAEDSPVSPVTTKQRPFSFEPPRPPPRNPARNLRTSLAQSSVSAATSLNSFSRASVRFSEGSGLPLRMRGHRRDATPSLTTARTAASRSSIITASDVTESSNDLVDSSPRKDIESDDQNRGLSTSPQATPRSKLSQLPETGEESPSSPVTPRLPSNRPRFRRSLTTAVLEGSAVDDTSSPPGSLMLEHKASLLPRRHSTQVRVYVPRPKESPPHPGSPPPSARPSFSNDFKARSPLRNSTDAAPPPSRAPSRRPSMTSSTSGSPVKFGFQQLVSIEEPGRGQTLYQLGNCIGKGQYGIVFRALQLASGQFAAVKRVNVEGVPAREVNQFMREVELLRRLSHPGIVQYIGMSRSEKSLDIVLEYVEGGSLLSALKSFGPFNERLAAEYCARILDSLCYLHGQEVVHCDLKAANILTTKTGNVKLTDFGVSLNMRAMDTSRNKVAGSPNWMAPEVIELKGITPFADIWSLGCTAIELVTGRPPFADLDNSLAVMYQVVEGEMPTSAGLSDDLNDFLRLCFRKTPSERPSAVELSKHPWIKAGATFDPAIRHQDSIPFLKRISGEYRFSIQSKDTAGPLTPRSSSSGDVNVRPGREGSSTSQDWPSEVSEYGSVSTGMLSASMRKASSPKAAEDRIRAEQEREKTLLKLTGLPARPVRDRQAGEETSSRRKEEGYPALPSWSKSPSSTLFNAEYHDANHPEATVSADDGAKNDCIIA